MHIIEACANGFFPLSGGAEQFAEIHCSFLNGRVNPDQNEHRQKQNDQKTHGHIGKGQSNSFADWLQSTITLLTLIR